MSVLYSAAYALLLIVTLPFWLVQMLRLGKYRAGLLQRFGAPPEGLKIEAEKRRIWVHAVSVGEVLAVSHVVHGMRALSPRFQVLVSTTTLAGQKLARERFGAEQVFYFPLDLPFAIDPYLQKLRPALVVIAETEFWPNFIRLAHKSGARIAAINSRISDRSFPGYLRFRKLLRIVLRKIDLFLTQSEVDAQRLIAIGAPPEKIRVSGNLKFEVTPPKELPIIDALGKLLAPEQPVLVCGSTVEGEEEMLLSAFGEILREFSGAIMVLAPRHPERFAAVAELIAASGLNSWRRSLWEPPGPIGGGILLLDTIGELSAMYSLATLAFVGGSLVAKGGHNILEPAYYAKAIVVGTHTENFRDIIRTFKGADALEITTSEKLSVTLLRLLKDPARREQLGANAKMVMEANLGSTARTLHALQSLLEVAMEASSGAGRRAQ